jgi:hypothetical protein
MSGIPAWAVKGAKVVCIQGGQPGCNGDLYGVGYPKTREVVTIDGVFLRKRDGRCLLTLIEYPSGNTGGGWNVANFRPLVTRSQDQDIALFVHHLDSVGEYA